jgi:hypothetical protein
LKYNQRRWYAVFLLGLPLFFILHGINENFCLIPTAQLLMLAAYYFTITIALSVLSALLLKQTDKAALFALLLLLVFFFFGVFKDLTKGISWLGSATSYKVLLPVLAIFIVAAWLAIKTSRRSFHRAIFLAGIIIFANILFEAAMLVYRQTAGTCKLQDLGDRENTMVQNLDSVAKPAAPDIFWIIMDEYSASHMLQSRWNFRNPLDSVLRNKGFFVADSARSPYNFTQYSLLASLDMQYLQELGKRKIITYKDIVRSHHSLYQNNTVQLFSANGYDIVNFSVSDFAKYPASEYSRFGLNEKMLIDNQTITGRIRLDIGWNFPHLFKNSRTRDSIFAADAYTELDRINDSLSDNIFRTLKWRSSEVKPAFWLLHTMFSHDPFLYDADGSLNIQKKLGVRSDRYIPSIQYTNTVIGQLIDSIMQWNKGKQFSIVLQGDHGYKFSEDDSLYEKGMCDIFYAVYHSDQDYGNMRHSINSVNTFRLLFRKYFNYPMQDLPGRSFSLYYR